MQFEKTRRTAADSHFLRCGLLAICILCLSATPLFAQLENWPQFRGPNALPVADDPGLPMKWSTTENVEWVTDIPGTGWSSPIVWQGKVFVTTATADTPMKQPSLGVDFSNDYVAELVKDGTPQEEVLKKVMARDGEMPDEVSLKYHLVALDLKSGRVLWQQEYHDGPPPVGRHRKNSYTSETPITDGRAVYVYAGFLGLFAFDIDSGEPLWKTPLKPYEVYLDFGTGASPVLHGERIYILSDNEESSFIAAYDKKSGRELWRTPRVGLSKGRGSAWATPFVWTNSQRTEIVTSGPGWVISYDPSGRELWRMSRMSGAIQSPFAWEDMVFVTSGAGGQNKPMVAIRPGGSGDITPPDGENSSKYVAWYNRTAGGTYLPTPVIYDERLYVLTDKGILSVLNPRTGRENLPVPDR